MARELPNPERGTAGQIPKIQSDGSYGLAADESGSGSGNPDVTYVSPTDDWVSIVEGASAGDTIWFLDGVHKDTHHSDTNEGPVLIDTNDITLHVSAGATVMARDGLNEEERFIQIHADDVTIQGSGRIDGNQANSTGLGGVESGGLGHEHIIDANRGSTPDIYNLTITGVTIENAGGGDCVYLNGAHDTIISNVRMSNGYRNAISIIDVDGLLMSNFITEDTQGVSPRSGVAFEPNGSGQEMKDITLENFITRNNGEMGLYVNTHWYGGYNTLADITITNGHADGNGQVVDNEVVTGKAPHYGQGFFFGNADYTNGIHLSNCTARDSWAGGFNAGGAEWIRFDNCRAISNGRSGSGASASGFVLEDGWQTDSPCNAVMSGCSAYDDNGQQEHPVLVRSGAEARVVDMQIGAHAASYDSIRVDGGTLEHHLIDVRTGDPAANENGGTATQI